MTKLLCHGYGRYILATTNLTGIFVVRVEGVTFHTNMDIYFNSIYFLMIIAFIVSFVIIRKRQKC